MSTKTSRRDGDRGRLWTPGRIAVLVLAVLTLIFIFGNTRETRVRLLIPEITMPLWIALVAMWVVGALCGGYLIRRR